MLFMILSLIAMACEQLQPEAYFDAHTYDLGEKDDAGNPTYSTKLDILGKLLTFEWGDLFLHPGAVLNAFVSMLFFDYSFFTGGWIWVRYIIFIPVGVGMAFALLSGLIFAIAGILGKIF